MKKILSIAIVLISIGASAQRWGRTYSFDNFHPDIGQSICSDSTGNVIVAGSSNYEKSILLKYDGSGNLIWADTSTAIDFRKVICIGDDIYVTGKGNIPFTGDRMIVGKWNSNGQNQWLLYDTISAVNDLSIGYDLTINSQNELIAVGEEVSSNILPTKLYLMNISLSGNLNWAQMYTVPQLYMQNDNRFVTDASGDIYLSRTEGNVFNGNIFGNAWLYKYDHTNGNLLWLHEMNVSDSTLDFEFCLGITSQGRIIQAVATNDSSFSNLATVIYQFDPSGNMIDSIYLNNEIFARAILDLNDDLYCINGSTMKKISLSGTILHSSNYAGYSNYFTPRDARTDSDGNLYLLGEDGLFNNNANYSVAKFDSTLNLLWADSIDSRSSFEDSPYSLFLSNNNDLMATGFGEANSINTTQKIFSVYWSHTLIQGINNTESYSNYFEIYPNPGKTEVNYKFSDGLSNKSSLSIYGMTGNLVHQQEITSAQGTINIDFAPGVYIVKVSSQENELVSRLVVE